MGLLSSLVAIVLGSETQKFLRPVLPWWLPEVRGGSSVPPVGELRGYHECPQRHEAPGGLLHIGPPEDASTSYVHLAKGKPNPRPGQPRRVTAYMSWFVVWLGS
jgi:hypothetical protein